jgi:phenylpyruvate tautomerase PptA (4-oxalocrotonate tautomerase family)
MPLLRIQTNVPRTAEETEELLRRASATVAELLGKPERYVMVSIEHAPHMYFGGSADGLAYCELKSIGLPEDRTAEISERMCGLLGEHLGIGSDRVYIEFADAQRHLWGWNGATF